MITRALKLGLSETRDGDTWQGEEAVIFIEWLASRLIGTVGSSSYGGAPSSGVIYACYHTPELKSLLVP